MSIRYNYITTVSILDVSDEHYMMMRTTVIVCVCARARPRARACVCALRMRVRPSTRTIRVRACTYAHIQVYKHCIPWGYVRYVFGMVDVMSLAIPCSWVDVIFFESCTKKHRRMIVVLDIDKNGCG